MASRLLRKLVDRIRSDGPITFAEFMDAALYDPDDGFYARPVVGPDRHFVTSPHVSPAFADLLARQLAETWEALGRPRPFTVVEVGAGDGTLARGILRAAAATPELEGAIHYAGVERTETNRAALAEAGLDVAPSLGDVAPDCVLANEVLDNLPFHRLRGREGGVVEVRVAVEGGALVEVEGAPDPAARAALSSPLADGEERRVAPAIDAFLREIASALRRGYAFLLDYATGGHSAPVHGYRDHGALEDVLDDPGSRDVTAAVDLEAAAALARAAGLQTWGPVPQREALLALGLRMWVQGVRRRQEEAEAAGRWRDATRLFAERSRASILVDPGKLGGHRLLILGTPGLPAPAAALGDRETGC
jgi:NADH dehydrogenase [ubiquinone] 1 alpha subcomplex assembly factor 7